MSRELKVGGLVPLTTIDFPGRLACVVFVHGCPWRCTYCHNPHLQRRPRRTHIGWSNVRAFLRRRVGLLDGVVFSGGEPTVDPALPASMQEARALGYAIGLHTAGTHPERLERCLPHADWVGMDVKADFVDYDRVTQVDGSAQRALASLTLLLRSGVCCELRTTWHPGLLAEAQLLALTDLLASKGVRHYALQTLRPQRPTEGTDAIPHRLVERLAARFPEFVLRTA